MLLEHGGPDTASIAHALLPKSVIPSSGRHGGRRVAWLTLNYLLGHLGRKEVDTVAAIDWYALGFSFRIQV